MENLGACWSEDGPRGTSADRQDGTRIRPCTLEGNHMQTLAAMAAEHASLNRAEAQTAHQPRPNPIPIAAPTRSASVQSLPGLSPSVRLRRDLGGRDAARDLWWIAGREGFFQLPVQFVVQFLFFALLACFFFLRHSVASL
jgi:hypothetical protein